MTIPAVLLASICMPMASADDAPRRIKLRPRPTIQQVAAKEELPATDRWQKLKAKYAEENESTTAKPPAKVASRPQSAGLIRPFPEDDGLEAEEVTPEAEDWAADESGEESISVLAPAPDRSDQSSAEPLPITGFEQPPDWILGGNADIAEDLAEEDASEFEPRRLAARRAAEESDEKNSAPEAEPARPLSEEDTKTPSGTDPGYTPMPSGSRRPRQIKDISPRYDTKIDQDIRTFAKEQALQYGLEFGKGVYEPRSFQGMAYLWEPTNFWHYPLYFEDPQLERYGHTYGCVAQPIASIARFSGQLLLLPYQMTIDPICCPKYSLGWYRPGDCAPYLHYQVPLNAQAAAVEAAVVTGFFFLIP